MLGVMFNERLLNQCQMVANQRRQLTPYYASNSPEGLSIQNQIAWKVSFNIFFLNSALYPSLVNRTTLLTWETDLTTKLSVYFALTFSPT